MTIELLPLLKNVCAGDESAWLTLKNDFLEKKLSAEEQTQVYLYIKQAAKTNVVAIYIHALLYDHGFGTKQDSEMAFLLMRAAAAEGHSAATFEVGRRFLYGIGIERNLESAFQWLTMTATSPHYHPAAMYHLGLMYEQGLGVPRDPAKAKEWQDKAREKGFKIV
ncbi:MAG: hypothetical protein ACD_45C00547G0004 [uncultured bacterium]|nr:MAG: hypothetical protein ACD_45C00547G0004 [uncultured bacterium]